MAGAEKDDGTDEGVEDAETDEGVEDAAPESLEDVLELEPLPRKVADVMTRKVITIGEDETLADAEGGMERFAFRHLPVVREGKLLGLITHKDILHASSSFLSEQAKERDEIIHRLPVSRIMQRDVLTVTADEALVAAAKLMWESRLGCLPVVDEEDRLVGILTEGDFVKLTIKLLEHGRPPPPSALPPRPG